MDRVAVFIEGVGAQRAGEILDGGQCVADRGRIGAAGVFDGSGHQPGSRVGLGCELVGIPAILGAVRLHKGGVLRSRVADVPGCTADGAFRSRTGDLSQLGAVEAVAADDGHVKPKLAGLDHDVGGLLGQRRHDQRLRLQRGDLGQLRREVGIAFGERLGGHYLGAAAGQRLCEHVVARLGKLIVVAVHHRDLAVAQLVLGDQDGVGDHVRLRQAVAEDVVAHVGDAGRGVGGAKHRDFGFLRYRVGREGRVGKRRTENRHNLVLVDQNLEGVDGLCLVAGRVLADDGQCGVAQQLLVVDLLGRQHDAVADRLAVDGDGAAERVGAADDDFAAQSAALRCGFGGRFCGGFGRWFLNRWLVGRCLSGWRRAGSRQQRKNYKEQKSETSWFHSG